MDSISDYSLDCDPDATGSATWQVTDGYLHGTMSGEGQCYASIQDQSWQISKVSFRVRGVTGIDKGITIHSTLGVLAVNLRADPYNDMMVTSGHGGEFTYYNLPHSIGEWLDVEVQITSDEMHVFVNGVLKADLPIAPDVVAAPFTDAHVFVYNGMVTDYDDIIIEGAGVVPSESEMWGSLKSLYR